LQSQRIFLVPKLQFSNSYFVDFSDGDLILIDTGTPGAYEKIISYLKSLGKSTNEIKVIALTHSDTDHSGSAKKIRDLSGSKIAIHELDAPRVSGKKSIKEVHSLMGNIMLGIFNAFNRFETFEADIIFKDCDSLSKLKVIHVPGHTEGSVCFYLPGVALFSGDTLRTSGGKVMLPPSYLNFDNILLRNSLKKLINLEFTELYPGHGKPIIRDADRAVRELVERLH
jgi:hydroxyacylglutathione hydrolase